jgi:hypothetical protein
LYKLLSGRCFLFLFLFAGETGFAQNWQAGLKGGLSLPDLSSSGSSDVSKGYQTISGPDFALVADYKLSQKVSIETGIEWSTQGGQKSGLQTIPASPELEQYFPPGSDVKYLYANFTSTVRLQYLMLPVLLKYTFDLGNSENWKWYLDGGPYAALMITATGSASGSSKVYYDQDETKPVAPIVVPFDSTGNIKNQLHKGNFGIEADLGLMYQMNSASFFIEGGGNYGFIDLQKNSQNGINHTGALIFRIGLFFSLNTK